MAADFSPGSSVARVAPGTRLNGIYEVDLLVASGGMGEVYRGHTIHTGDPVAIKLLRPEFGENEAALGLFRKEASALHTLHHDAIVRYYVCSVDPDLRRPYLAMEFVEGRSLSHLLRDGPLTFEAVRTLGQRIAAGLHAAHEHGIVHRDVAPDNIIVPDGDVGRAKIIDFGIARFTQTKEGTIIGGGFAGKYKYVSPEQLGLFGGDVTAKSDIYSLGLVLAEAMTGQAIDMAGSQVQVVEKRRKVPDLGGIDMRMRPLLEQMLQPDPSNRPGSMNAVAAMLAGSSVAPSQGFSGPPRVGTPSSRKRWLLAGAACAAVVLIGGIAAVSLWQPEAVRQSPAPPSLQGDANGASGTLATAPSPLAAPGPGPGDTLPPSAAPALHPAPPEEKLATAPLPSEVSPVAPSTPSGPPDVPQLAPPQSTTRPSSPMPETNVAKASPDGGLDANAPASARVGRVDRITRYVNEYDGGDCFFVTPISVGDAAARIEGYGHSLAPFQALDSDFKKANGFEADIGIRQVTERQCPAITFLGRLRAQRGAAPQLDIGQTSLRSGEILTGSVTGYGDRNLELLLVSDDGSVNNVTALTKTTPDGRSFSLRMQLDNLSAAQPQILLAVVSARPLSALQPQQPADAAQVFPAALAEAARTGQTIAAAASYFKLE
jgi:serine/threonine-protein kinase